MARSSAMVCALPVRIRECRLCMCILLAVVAATASPLSAEHSGDEARPSPGAAANASTGAPVLLSAMRQSFLPLSNTSILLNTEAFSLKREGIRR